MNRTFLSLLVITSVIALGVVPAQADGGLIDKAHASWERWKLRDNQKNGADHDVDCIIQKRGDQPYCMVHKTSSAAECPAIATGNFDREGNWTKCDPVVDEEGYAYCAAHDSSWCPMLQTWSPDQDLANEESPYDHSTRDCKKVYKGGQAYCATHDTTDCFLPKLPCYVPGHEGKMCGKIRKGSVERQGYDLVVAGVRTTTIPIINITTRHTEYVWAPRQ